jgi:hypothetical protein
MADFGALAAADTANMQAGGDSFFDSIGMALTAGVTGAAVSGLQSIYNTGVDVSNKVFDTQIDRANTADTLNSIDENWGQYYTDHKDTIDLAGFAATSFIPGGLAVKGLKMLQKGESVGAFRSVLGFTSNLEQRYLKQAVTDLGTEGGSVFTRISATKLKALAAGAADQVLQAATFELATVATMKASPFLDKESWQDLGWDIMKTGLVGGAIGGTIGGLLNSKLLKDVGTEVEKRTRIFDVLKNTGNVGLDIGDKAFSVVDAIAGLPPEVAEAVSKIPVAKLGMNLDITKLLEKTLDKTQRSGLQQFEQLMTDVVENDKTVGKPVGAAFLRMFQQGKEAGVGSEEIRKTIGGYLLGLKGVEGVGNVPGSLTNNFVHLPAKPSVVGDIRKLFSSTPFEKGTSYRLMGDLADLKQGVLGKDAMSAQRLWEQGFDTAIDPETKLLVVNPNSKLLYAVDVADSKDTWLYFSTRTGQTVDSIAPTIADVATPQAPLKISTSGIQSGKHTFSFTAGGFNPAMTPLEATARNAWASQGGLIAKGVVDARDFSVLDSLLFDHMKAAQDLSIKLPSGATLPFADISDLKNFVLKQKIDAVTETLASGAVDDIRELAQKVNVDPSWIETATANKFDRRAMADAVEQWMQDPKQYSVRENVIFKYRTPNMSDGTPEALTQWRNRVSEAQDRAKGASAQVLGDHYEKFLDLLAGQSLSQGANQVGNGAGFFGASNANYNDPIAVWSQATGATTHAVIEARSNEVLTALQGPAAKLLATPQAAAEVAAVVAKARASDVGFHIYTDQFGKRALVDFASLDGVRSGKLSGFKTMIPLSEEAGDFLATHQQLHADWIADNTKLLNAQGEVSRFDPDIFYAPPVDTKRFPFFAFVKQTDGRIFGSSDVSLITARDATELQAKVAQIEKIPGLEVHFKKDTEAFYKAKGDYDFARAMNDNTVNNTLKREGILNDLPLPNLNPESVVQDFVNFAQRRTEKLVRDAVSVNYAQPIAELQDLSARYTAAATSKFEGLAAKASRNIADPFGDYTRTALDISKQSEFTLWHNANEFVDAVGTKAYRMVESAVLDAKNGKISWEDANATMEKFGIGKVFQDEEMFGAAQTAPDRSLIRSYINKANALLSTAVLRLDWANSIVNTISTPILLGTEVAAIRQSLAKDPEFLSQWSKMFSEAVPGGIDATGAQLSVPSTTRLVANAIKNSFGDTGKELTARYKDIGTIKGIRALVHEMNDDLSIVPGMAPKEWGAKVDKWIDKAASVTFSNQAEEFTRFVTSDVMRQITDPLVQAGKMATQEQNAFIQIFTNRVQGNYVASQRPIMFQGVLGSAIGLFQTYQFNTLQQLFRHVEDRNLKTLATFGALQTTLYGLNGLPFFDAINTHLLGTASVNEGHNDVFSYAQKAMGHQLGDWLMYGTASSFPLFGDKGPALYSRGDLNPRSALIVPTSIGDVPAVNAAVKVVQNVVGFASRIANGGTPSESLLFGLEHNGINRPLAGMAQMLKGNATTQSGDLIAAQSDMYSIASLSRLIGSRPMDEAMGVAERYRSKVYEAVDKSRMENLGEVIKDKMRNDQQISSDDWLDLQSRYAAAGGRVQGFASAVQRWDKSANTSVINSAMLHNQTMAGQRMIMTMGGQPVEDYTNQVPPAQ